MSRPALSFLRPFLSPAGTIKPEHARAYLSIQRRFTQSLADNYTGIHDVEKHKRLEQLRTVRALDTYHPRLVHPQDAESLSLRDFNVKYESLEETAAEAASVFGMACL